MVLYGGFWHGYVGYGSLGTLGLGEVSYGVVWFGRCVKVSFVMLCQVAVRSGGVWQLRLGESSLV